jgi:hypothetical protein
MDLAYPRRISKFQISQKLHPTIRSAVPDFAQQNKSTRRKAVYFAET